MHFPLNLSLTLTYLQFFFAQYMETYFLVYLLISLFSYFARQKMIIYII